MSRCRKKLSWMIQPLAWQLTLAVCMAMGVWGVGALRPITEIPLAIAAHNEFEEHETPTPEYTASVAQFPDDAEIVDAQTALNEMNAKNEAIKREFPQLAKIDDQTFSGGNLNQGTGAPNGDNFGRVTPSRLGRGLSPGSGMENMTNQLMQQAFQSLMKGKSPGAGSQFGEFGKGGQPTRQVAQKPAQNQPAKGTSEEKATPTPTGSKTPGVNLTPQPTPTPPAAKTESPAATPTPMATGLAENKARSSESSSAPTATPRPATAQWRAVSSSQKNPYRF